jgi:hypothetical protein
MKSTLYTVWLIARSTLHRLWLIYPQHAVAPHPEDSDLAFSGRATEAAAGVATASAVTSALTWLVPRVLTCAIVWNVSHGVPAGSTTQCLSETA